MRVGFIGLGTLGSVMAKRLISEGVEITLWNRTKKKARALGAPVAENPAKLVSGVDVLFLNLFDSHAVRDVLTQKNGILTANLRGRVIVDTTTNHFRDVLDFYRLVEDRGGRYIEAPVLGSVVPASLGKLTILVSGDSDAYEMVRPLIVKLGEKIFYLKKRGLASKMKLINNLVLGAFMTTLSEAIIMGEASGIKKETLVEILGSGAGNSLVLNAKRDKILQNDFSTQFSVSLIYKDLHYLQDLARELKMPLFMGSISKELYSLAKARGMGQDDFSSVYMALKELFTKQ
ncbi:MAG: NAD(P)-dependent oxidoreductase [Nitrospirae bacterium]|nr:NAD(P)-dependent oxidoreductase [Nitrospirota bacterium]